jgi:phage/plasmid-like protein (TIGR03299 family)
MMAHEILETEDGTFAMAYRAGDPVPWHSPETNPQTFAAGATPQEIMAAARLDYAVQLVPNCFPDGSPIPESFHISRVDNPTQVFGRFVAGNWQPVQNAALLDLAAHIEFAHDFRIITAGALFGGAKVFVQLETDKSLTLAGGDRLVSRLLTTVSHRGDESNKFVGCNTRVVCENTVQAAAGEGAGIVAHDHRVEFDHDAIVTAIGLNAESFGEFGELAQRMATRALSDSEALDYFRTVLGGREKTEESGRVRHSIAVRKAVAAYRGQEFVPIGASDSAGVALYVADRLDQIARGAATPLPADVTTAPVASVNPGHDLESARGSLWGAFNTVIWMSDHLPIKNRGVDFNLASNLLGEGTGGRIKARAQRAAVELLAA